MTQASPIVRTSTLEGLASCKGSAATTQGCLEARDPRLRWELRRACTRKKQERIVQLTSAIRHLPASVGRGRAATRSNCTQNASAAALDSVKGGADALGMLGSVFWLSDPCSVRSLDSERIGRVVHTAGPRGGKEGGQLVNAFQAGHRRRCVRVSERAGRAAVASAKYTTERRTRGRGAAPRPADMPGGMNTVAGAQRDPRSEARADAVN